MGLQTGTSGVNGPRGGRDTRRAWVCLALWPIAFAVALVAGEGTSALLGYDGVGPAPWGVAFVSLIVATVIVAGPAVLAVGYWRRAQRLGDGRAKVPALVLVVLVAGFIATNLLSVLIGAP